MIYYVEKYIFISVQKDADTMRNKLLTIVILLVFLAGCYSDKRNNNNMTQTTICKVENCSNICERRNKNSSIYLDYCKEHLCKEEYCGSPKDIGNDYCSFHKILQIQLSDEQITEAQKLVDEYCKKIMSKQSNILAINLFHDKPKTTSQYIYFDCNVVREDSNTNLATIYLYLTSEGDIKIKELKYDD